MPGALPDYLEEQGDLVEGTDYQTLLTSAIQQLHRVGEHKTWQWFSGQDAMCLTQAEFRLVHECCVPVEVMQHAAQRYPCSCASANYEVSRHAGYENNILSLDSGRTQEIFFNNATVIRP